MPAFSVKDYEWVLYTQGRVRLTCGELCYEIEPGVCARTFSGLDAVDNWSVGYLRGGVYKSEAASFRLRQKPALDTVLQLPVLEGKPCLRIGDVMGRHFYYLLDGENADGIF